VKRNQKVNTQSTQKEFYPLTKVFLEVENSQMKKGKSLKHLILKETTTKLKEKK